MFLKTLLVECMPQGNHLKRNLPIIVLKANKLEAYLSNLICQKPKLASNLKKYVASHTVGKSSYFCLIAWLSTWSSREIRSFPFCFCTMTMPLTESVSWSVGSIMLSSSIQLSFYFTFDSNASSILQMVLTTGGNFFYNFNVVSVVEVLIFSKAICKFRLKWAFFSIWRWNYVW